MEKEISNRSDHMKEYINKVAEKLSLPPEKVAMAMQSVRKEGMDQIIMEKIQEAVQKGIITQNEAGPIREWVKNRPEGVQKLLGQMFGRMGRMMGMMM